MFKSIYLFVGVERIRGWNGRSSEQASAEKDEDTDNSLHTDPHWTKGFKIPLYVIYY